MADDDSDISIVPAPAPSSDVRRRDTTSGRTDALRPEVILSTHRDAARRLGDVGRRVMVEHLDGPRDYVARRDGNSIHGLARKGYVAFADGSRRYTRLTPYGRAVARACAAQMPREPA